MAELDPEVARAVDALRAKRSPPVAAKDRVHALLEARLGDPEPGGESGDGGPESGGSTGGTGVEGLFVAKVVGATAALTAGGLLALKLGVLAAHSLTSPSTPTPEHATQAPHAAASAPTPVSAEPPASLQPVVEPPHHNPTPAPAKPGKPKPSALPSKPASPSPDISAELALIQAARAASSPEAAIAALQEHARRFSDGMLRDEREALWAIASCEREDFADGTRRARALAARRPNSPLLDRVTKACPEIEH